MSCFVLGALHSKSHISRLRQCYSKYGPWTRAHLQIGTNLWQDKYSTEIESEHLEFFLQQFDTAKTVKNMIFILIYF